MLFVTIFAQALGINISAEGITAMQHVAMTSAGAGAAISVVKRMRNTISPPEPKSIDPDTMLNDILPTMKTPELNPELLKEDNTHKTPPIEVPKTEPFKTNIAWSEANNRKELPSNNMLVVWLEKEGAIFFTVDLISSNGMLMGHGQEHGKEKIQLYTATMGKHTLDVTIYFKDKTERYANYEFYIV